MKLLLAIALLAICGFLWGYLMGVIFTPLISVILGFVGGYLIGYFGMRYIMEKL